VSPSTFRLTQGRLSSGQVALEEGEISLSREVAKKKGSPLFLLTHSAENGKVIGLKSKPTTHPI